MKFGRAIRHRGPGLDAELRDMEARDPKLRELGGRLEDVGRAIAGLPTKHRPPDAVLAREQEAKGAREAEAEAWIAEVRARKAKR